MRIAIATMLVALVIINVGCTQRRPDFFARGQNSAAVPRPGGQLAQAAGGTADAGQLESMNSRLSQFDADNRELHSQIAQLQQQLNLSNEEKRLLRTQMGDAANQLRDLQVARNQTESQMKIMQASNRSGRAAGVATIRANNSLAERMDSLRVTGVEVRQDGDVVRVDLPSDRLFVQGTYQLQQSGTALLDQIAAEIRRNYPRQLVGIEGHTDNVPIAGTVTTHHQISNTQSMTVFNYLSRTGYLPEKQMFTMAVGSNQPRFSNGDPEGRARNRRIEIVVYPETFEGG